MTECIRVLIADDQAITRTGLQHLLAEDTGIEVVGAARTGAETVALAESLQPDVILMDLRMPDGNGIEATRRIYRASPHVGILVLTVFEDDASVFPAIRAGARGYLLKDTQQDELLRAIRTVAQVEAIFSPGIAQRVLSYLSARRWWQRARLLTNWHRASVRFSKGSPKDRPTARSQYS